MDDKKITELEIVDSVADDDLIPIVAKKRTKAARASSLRGNGGATPVAGYINVTDGPYNAKGNGTADDTAAIQAAIDAANAGPLKTVFFPKGTYKITATLTVPAGVTLLGAFAWSGSADTSRLVTSAALSPMVDARHSTTFQNLLFDLNNAAACALFTDGNYVHVRDCWFTNGPVGSSMIKIGGSLYPVIERCLFTLIRGYGIDAQKAYNTAPGLTYGVNVGQIEKCLFFGGPASGGCNGAIRWSGILTVQDCDFELAIRGTTGDEKGAICVSSLEADTSPSHSVIANNYFEINQAVTAGLLPVNAILLLGLGNHTITGNTAYGLKSSNAAFIRSVSEAGHRKLTVVGNNAEHFRYGIRGYGMPLDGALNINGNSGTGFVPVDNTTSAFDVAPSSRIAAIPATAGGNQVWSIFANAGPHIAMSPQLALPNTYHAPATYPSLPASQTLNLRLGNCHTFNGFDVSPITFSAVSNAAPGALYLFYCRDGGVTLTSSVFRLVEGANKTMAAGEHRLFWVDGNGLLREIPLSSSLVLASPNGNKWRIAVDNTGALSAVSA